MFGRMRGAAPLLLMLVAATSLGRAGNAAKPLRIKAAYPEGPAVIGKAVYWAEMPLDRVRELKDGHVRTVWSSANCGPTAVRPTPQGDVWVLCHLGGRVLLLDSNWRLKKEVTYTTSGTRVVWPNDGKVDAAGNIYLSSSGIFSFAAPSTGTVVRISPSGEAVTIAGPFHYTNGISLNPSATLLYVSEHLERRIWALQLNNGQVVGKSLFFDFNAAGLSRPDYAEAGPDGQWLSPSGDLFVAEYGGGRIIHIGAGGTLKGVIKTPTKYVTNMVPSPFHPGHFIVTGTFDNQAADLPGMVFETGPVFVPGH